MPKSNFFLYKFCILFYLLEETPNHPIFKVKEEKKCPQILAKDQDPENQDKSNPKMSTEFAPKRMKKTEEKMSPIVKIKIERESFDFEDLQANENEKSVKFSRSLIDTKQTFHGSSIVS